MAAININNEQFVSMIHGEKPVLVDFWAPWCSYCRRIGPAYDRIAQKFEESVIVAKINIDDYPQLAEGEAIEVIPTLVLYKNGKAIDSIVAPESMAVIEQFLQNALNK